MQDLIAIPPSNHLEEEDQEALELFNQVAAEISSEPPHIDAEPDLNIEHSDEEVPVLSRLSKMKKQSKKESKKRKIKEKLKLKKKKFRKDHESPAPKKKIKRDPSTRKKTDKEDAEDSFKNDDKGSSEFDSDSLSEDLDLELKNLNPDFEEDESPKKRLIKSGRKQKIQSKEGFKLSELGNDPDVEMSQSGKVDYSDDDYSSDARKKKRTQKKSKVVVPSNAQIMNLLKQQGVVESQEEEQVNKDYDRGLDMIQNLKKKSKDGISIKNRLFGDLQLDLQNEEAEVVAPPENFELELNPKNSSAASSQRLSFFSKAQGIKKSRGLEAQVDAEEYQRKADEKVKKSMAKLISSLTSQEFHDDLDLEVRVPTIARGKSANLINNTVFLRSQLSKQIDEEEEPSQLDLKQTKSMTFSHHQPRKEMSRQQLFKEIQEQTRLRRSKYISKEELKNSFKKTNLEELEQFRKKMQEKKRKEALSDNESDSVELDSEMKEMIEKEEKICGQINNDEEEEQKEEDRDWKPEEENNEVQKVVQEQAEQQQGQNEEEMEQKVNDAAQEELEEYNQLLNQLHSVSKSHKSPQQEQKEDVAEEKQEQEVDNEDNEQSRQINMIENEQMPQEEGQNEESIQNLEEQFEKEKQIKELEEEGIHMNKRRKNIDDGPIDEQKYLLHQEIEGQQPFVNPEVVIDKKAKFQIDEDDDEFNNFRKLRRIAVVIARKKKEREMGRQFAAQFVQHEAEQGSDNQDHDDIIKTINHAEEDKQYEGIDLDADLVELIDNAVDINEEDEYEAFRKYLEDVRMQDRQEIRKIVKGQFWNKHQDLEIELEEDERKRIQRMEEVMNWMKKREEEEGEGIYMKEPQPEEKDSDEGSINGDIKEKEEDQDMLNESASEQLDPQQQMERLNKYLQEEMPSTKREYKPVGNINFMSIPESVKRESSKTGSQKRISMSKFGSFTGTEVNPQTLIHKKSTSSLVNQMLNKNVFKPRKPIATLFGKNNVGKKK